MQLSLSIITPPSIPYDNPFATVDMVMAQLYVPGSTRELISIILKGDRRENMFIVKILILLFRKFEAPDFF